MKEDKALVIGRVDDLADRFTEVKNWIKELREEIAQFVEQKLDVQSVMGKSERKRFLDEYQSLKERIDENVSLLDKKMDELKSGFNKQTERTTDNKITGMLTEFDKRFYSKNNEMAMLENAVHDLANNFLETKNDISGLRNEMVSFVESHVIPKQPVESKNKIEKRVKKRLIERRLMNLGHKLDSLESDIEKMRKRQEVLFKG
jgi:hypothetical protein